MRQQLLVSLLFVCGIVHAQNNKEQPPSQELIVKEARQYLRGMGGKPYDPGKAQSLHLQNAQQGNVQSMYELALMYSKGTGIPVNQTAAIEWFNKAAENGYSKAWCNLGEVYRKGQGTPIDYSKARSYYEKASAAGDLSGRYNLAYLAYKGLGCTQNYQQAFSLFYEAALQNYVPAMYFTGLCFRNGYGTIRNLDSARRYLMRAAIHGSAQAREELAIKDPENPIQPLSAPALVQAFSVSTLSGESGSRYQRIQHNVPVKDLGGDYTGYAIKYDWSGTHVTAYATVNVTLTLNGTEVTGTWREEDESLTTEIHAQLTENALVFSNTGYDRIYRYSPVKPETFTFQQAALQLVQKGDSIYVAGNLQTYSANRGEPGKPFSLLLVKKSPETVTNLPLISAIGQLQAYPNPFNQATTISFRLDKEAGVALSVLDLQGRTIYTEPAERLLPGTYRRSLPLHAPAGNYVVRLVSNGVSKTLMIVKQ
ncbi:MULTISPECIES: T9SS type A sorting domain-containing protein [Niastella]|uniref:SEL1-like repeat protein n=1 Tax=Niastella soli TaxID=2821487 RepID=A0ABS3Z5F1_9BACT|nr:T9SS type A sorting domain-containing protein [Niastella soli]MBO9205400.1 SEL1-like repeat protein [Niastella soli]